MFFGRQAIGRRYRITEDEYWRMGEAAGATDEENRQLAHYRRAAADWRGDKNGLNVWRVVRYFVQAVRPVMANATVINARRSLERAVRRLEAELSKERTYQRLAMARLERLSRAIWNYSGTEQPLRDLKRTVHTLHVLNVHAIQWSELIVVEFHEPVRRSYMVAARREVVAYLRALEACKPVAALLCGLRLQLLKRALNAAAMRTVKFAVSLNAPETARGRRFTVYTFAAATETVDSPPGPSIASTMHLVRQMAFKTFD